MGYKTYLSGIYLGTMLAGVVFVLVVLNLDPDKGVWSIAAFLGCVFFLTFGLFTLLGFYGRKFIFGNEILYANVGIAARQGFLLAAYTDIILILKAYELLVWWDALLLFFSIILMELYFRAKE